MKQKTKYPEIDQENIRMLSELDFYRLIEDLTVLPEGMLCTDYIRTDGKYFNGCKHRHCLKIIEAIIMVRLHEPVCEEITAMFPSERTSTIIYIRALQVAYKTHPEQMPDAQRLVRLFKPLCSKPQPFSY